MHDFGVHGHDLTPVTMRVPLLVIQGATCRPAVGRMLSAPL